MDASHADGGITYAEVELSIEKTFFYYHSAAQLWLPAELYRQPKKKREMLGFAKKSETSFTSRTNYKNRWMSFKYI